MSVITAPQPRQAQDWYVEPAWCVDALIQAERFEGAIWDPACGCGTIPQRFRAAGYLAAGTDIADRGFGGVHDFLSGEAKVDAQNIVCNPPYKLAPEFIRQALALADRKVAMIVQQQFPYSQGRHALFTQTPLARLYFLSQRPSMPPGDKLLAGEIEAKGGSVDYLWMVWDKAHTGAPTAHWLLKPSYDARLDGRESYNLAVSEIGKRQPWSPHWGEGAQRP